MKILVLSQQDIGPAWADKQRKGPDSIEAEEVVAGPHSNFSLHATTALILVSATEVPTQRPHNA